MVCDVCVALAVLVIVTTTGDSVTVTVVYTVLGSVAVEGGANKVTTGRWGAEEVM